MKDTLHYIRTLCRFVLLGLLVGLVCGAVGTAFYHAIALATRLRTGHPWLLYLLPVAGLLTAYLYALLKMEKDPGTDAVLRTTKDAQTVPARLAALIFSGTFLTHLCGGSAGREGAALQIGGGLGTAISRLLKLSEGETKLVTMCGMSAVFSAVFGTPLTAAVFSIEVASVGMISSTAMLPCAISSLTAAYIARLLGAAGEAYALEGVPALNLQSLLPALLLGLICALVSILFCEVMHASRRLFGRWFPNRYVRVAVGAVLVVGASLLLGTGRYNGAGADVIAQAIEEGRALPYDGIVKLLLTAITLGCGMKGILRLLRGGPVHGGPVLRGGELPHRQYPIKHGALRGRGPAPVRPGRLRQLRLQRPPQPLFRPKLRVRQGERVVRYIFLFFCRFFSLVKRKSGGKRETQEE